jgi:predicted transcriptional regulator
MGLFLLENQMNQTIVNNYFKALEALLTAGSTYAQALAKLKTEYDKASDEDKKAIRNRVAQVIGKKYGVKPKIMEKGSNKGLLGFNAHGSKAESNARDFMRDNFKIEKVVVGKKPTTKVSKKLDKVEQALALVESLSKAEQAKFFSRVSRK